MWYIITRSQGSAWEASDMRESYLLAKSLARSVILSGKEAFVRAEQHMQAGTNESPPNSFEKLSFGG
jgi:hypothetical protein